MRLEKRVVFQLKRGETKTIKFVNLQRETRSSRGVLVIMMGEEHGTQGTCMLLSISPGFVGGLCTTLTLGFSAKGKLTKLTKW